MKRKKLNIPVFARKALAIFIAAMAILTILSRVADSFMMPQVSVSTLQEMRLDSSIEVSGKIVSGEETAIYGEENLRVAKIMVKENDMINAGDVLLIYDTSYLDSQIENLETELTKIQLQIEDLENTKASQQEERTQNINRAKEDYQDTVTAAQQNVDNAYQKMIEAEQALTTHRNNQPAAQNPTDEAPQNTESEETAETSENPIETPQQEWETKDTELDQGYTQMKALYEEALKEKETTIKNSARQIEDAETPVKEDNTITLQEIDQKKQKEQLTILKKWRKKGGKFTSKQTGRVSSITVEIGTITSTSPLMIIEDFSGKLEFKGELDESTAAEIEEGTPCSITFGTTTLERIEIEHIYQNEETRYYVSAAIDSDKIKKPTNATMRIEKSSKKYPNCIPISSIYGGTNGDYLLAIEKSNTILGVQYTATRIPITILEQNGKYAAVEGNLSGSSIFVVNTSKTIEDGDRVRLVEEENET